MRVSYGVVAVLLAILAPFLPVEAQETAKPFPETRMVLRVSRKFIQRLVGRGFQRDEPVDANYAEVAVTGSAHVSGQFLVTLHESKTECNFDVLLSGDVLTALTATKRPVMVQLHGAAGFSGRRPIVHKDNQFISLPLTMEVCNHFTLDEICSFHRGLMGVLTRRVAHPFVRRDLIHGDCTANDEIRTRMTQALEPELDKLVVALNQIPPLVKQAHELIILENKRPLREERPYRAATREHLMFSIGGPDQRMPELLNLDKDKQAPLELWIAVSKNAVKEERRRFMLEHWRMIAPFLGEQLQRRSPELSKELGESLAQLLDDVQIHEVDGWHVIGFAPKIHTAPVKSP